MIPLVQKTLVIVPENGIGNRLQAILSTQILAQRQGWNVQVDWQPNRESCHCHLTDLFEENPGCPAYSVNLCPTGAVCLLERLEQNRIDTLEDLMETHPMVCVRSYVQFHDSSTSWQEHRLAMLGMFDHWKPAHSIAHQILEPDPDVIGVHIRGTDSIRCICFTPLALYIQFIISQLEHSPHSRFFVCSDEHSSVHILRQRFGDGRILTYNHAPANRITMEGIQHALIEFLTLARCRLICASYYSSFADLAVVLGNKPSVKLTTYKAPLDWTKAGEKFEPWVSWQRGKGWTRKKKRGLWDTVRSHFALWRTRWYLTDFYQTGFWHKIG